VTSLFTTFLNMSLTAGYVALAVIIICFLLHKLKLPTIFAYVLWLAVGFRLAVPVSFSSKFSLLGLLNPAAAGLGTMEYIPSDLGYMHAPAINSGIGSLNSAVNSLLPPANPEGSINPMQFVMDFAALIWLAGIVILLVYSLISYGRILFRVRDATLVRDHIFESDRIAIPFVCGLFRPRIFVPLGMEKNRLNYILAHEQTHIRRLDFVVKPLAFLLLIVHWYNPLMWVSFQLMSKDMEMSCDERVLKQMDGVTKSGYASALLDLSLQNSGLPMGSTLAFGESHIKSRIKNILAYKKPNIRVTGVTLLITGILFAAFAANPAYSVKSPAQLPPAAATSYDFQRMLANKTPYIGDSSKVIALIDAMSWPAGVTRETIELQTANPPYGLHIHLKMTDAAAIKTQGAIDTGFLYPQSVLLFSLIDSLDVIQLTLLDYTGDFDGASYSVTFTRESVEQQLGNSINSYSYSESTLRELLELTQARQETSEAPQQIRQETIQAEWN